MKKKYLIIIIGQSIIIFLMLIYAFFQKSIADEQIRLAHKNLKLAEAYEKRCEEAIQALKNK